MPSAISVSDAADCAASHAFSARTMRFGMTSRRMSLAEPAARSAARRASA
jgi:hypothetical protein